MADAIRKKLRYYSGGISLAVSLGVENLKFQVALTNVVILLWLESSEWLELVDDVGDASS